MKTFTVRRLWRMAAWGALAMLTLFAAGFASRSDIGAQRTADILTTIRGQSLALLRPAREPIRVGITPSNREGETRRLADAVRELAAESDQIKARIAAVERNMDDVTGSLTKDIEAAKAANPVPYSAPWPGDASAAAPSPSTIANVVTPVVPRPDGVATPLPPTALMSAGPAAAPAHPTQYAVDLGSAESIEALRARWTSIHAVHAQLFDGLTPAVTLKTVPRSNRVELRLMAGPLPSEELATQLCASLKAARRACEPIVFSTERLALQ